MIALSPSLSKAKKLYRFITQCNLYIQRYFTLKNSTLCQVVFSMAVRTRIDFFRIQHLLVNLLNGVNPVFSVRLKTTVCILLREISYLKFCRTHCVTDIVGL